MRSSASRTGRRAGSHATYADLAAQPRYLRAIEFFETELYGGGDFAKRDADLARVMPVMSRMLPAGVIGTVAKAVALNALSQELDRVLLARLARPDGRYTVAEYCHAFRKMGRWPERERQIALIGEIRTALDHYVDKPLIHGALKMMRQPAKLAGLERSSIFSSAASARFAGCAAPTIFSRRSRRARARWWKSIFAGETAPFPDPVQTLRAAAPPQEAPAD